MTFEPVATTDELADGDIKPIEVAGVALVLCRSGDDYFATQRKCIHQGGDLVDGLVSHGAILCALHGWRFQLASGQTLIGDGTVDGAFESLLGSTVSPGASPGIITYTSGVTLGGMNVFELAGTDGPGAAAGHDQYDVTGGVAIVSGASNNASEVSASSAWTKSSSNQPPRSLVRKNSLMAAHQSKATA